MKILVTGGLGFIGSHVCLELLKFDYEIIVLDSFVNSSKNKYITLLNLVKKFEETFIGKLRLVEGDLRNESLLENLFFCEFSKSKPITAVIHCAGLKSVGESIKNPIDYWNTNVSGSINLLKAMNKYNCKNLIFSSSATIYSKDNSIPLKENANFKPVNPYGNTKLAVEHLHKILAVYQADAGAWYELSEIHLAFGEYAEAAHCCEELVMLKPTSCVYHNRLADVYYSMGGEESLRLARKHYTMSLNYQAPEINVHAVYGLRATSELLELEIKGKEGKSESMTKNTGKNESNGADTNAVSDSEVNKELLSFAVDKLTSMGIA